MRFLCISRVVSSQVQTKNYITPTLFSDTLPILHKSSRCLTVSQSDRLCIQPHKDLKRNKYLSSHVMCGNRLVSQPVGHSQSRNIFIGPIASWIADRASKGADAFPELWYAFGKSVPVTCVRDYYLWVEATTGLPWWVAIVLSTVLVRSLLFVPPLIYKERLLASRELCHLEWLPYKKALESANIREKALLIQEIKALKERRKILFRENNCQTYKLFAVNTWQVLNMVLLSTGLRECLFVPESGIRTAELPWGSLLGYPDVAFVLPVLNVFLNLILIELDSMKYKKSSEEIEMSLSRLSVRKLAKERRPVTQFYINRFVCLVFFAVYITVPSSLNLVWGTMLTYTCITRFAFCKPKIRRSLGIPYRCYETDQPYKDLLLHLGQSLGRWQPKKKL